MLSCFKPEPVNKAQVLLDLKRSRDAAENDAHILRQQLHAVQQQAGAQQRAREQEQKLRETWEALFTEKSHALVQVLHRGSPGPQLAHGGDDVQSPPKGTPEEHIESTLNKLENQHNVILRTFQTLTTTLATTQQHHVKLEEHLAAAKQAKERAEAQNKCQHDAFDVERSALNSQAASVQEINAELSSQLEAAQVALQAAKTARLAAVEAEVKSRQEVTAARQELDQVKLESHTAKQALQEAQAEIQSLVEQVTSLQDRLAAEEQQAEKLRAACTKHESALEALVSQLAATEQQLAASQSAAQATASEVEALRGQVVSSSAQVEQLHQKLTASQAALTQAKAQEATLSSAVQLHEARLMSTIQEAQTLRERLAQTEDELDREQASSAASSKTVLQLKQELAGMRQQLASVAQDYSRALSTLGGKDGVLSDTQTQLKESESRLLDVQLRLSDASSRAATAESCLAATQQDLAGAQGQVHGLSEQLAALQALLGTTIALCTRGGSALSERGGATGPLTMDEQSAYGSALAADGRLSLQLANTPWTLLSYLSEQPQAQACLRDMNVELDLPQDTSLDQVVLRCVSLIGLLNKCSGLSRLSVWGHAPTAGVPLASPFIALAALAQVPPVLPPAAGDDFLTTQSQAQLQLVQIESQLIGPGCAQLLLDLLVAGRLKLSSGEGQPGLLLHSGHDHLDTWYLDMVRTANPMLTSQHSSANLGHGADGLGHEPQLPSVRSTPAHSVAGGSAGGDGLTRNAAASTVKSLWKSPSQHGAASRKAGSVCASDLSGASAATHLTASGLGGARSAAVDCQLVALGLTSHHMVQVAVVLVTCPHIRKLSLDNNQIGNAGAEVLGLALRHASGLRDLSLSGNNITQEGLSRLAPGLLTNTCLKRLQLGEHRVGAARSRDPTTSATHGVDTLARVLLGGGGSGLHELILTGMSPGEQGAAALIALLPTPHPLTKLVMSCSCLPPVAINRLQAAAAAKRGFLLTLQ